MKRTTWNFVQSWRPDIALIQEIRQSRELVENKSLYRNISYTIRDDGSFGGGTAIVTVKNIFHHQPVSQGDSTNCRLCSEKFNLFAWSIYRQRETLRELIAAMEKNMCSIQSLYPDALYVIGGDFNQPKDISQLEEFCERWSLDLHSQNDPTFRRVNEGKVVESRLDYLICSKAIKVSQIPCGFTKISDHRPLVFELDIPRHENTHLNRTILKKKTAKEVLEQIPETIFARDSPKEILHLINETLEKNKFQIETRLKTAYARKYDIKNLEKKITLDDDEYIQFLNREWTTTINGMEDLRPKNETKLFFEKLHAFSLYDQLEKRDGSIVSVIRDEEDQLITSSSRIDDELIKVLRQLHGTLTGTPRNASLPALTIEETIPILDRMSKDKGISMDLISDHLFQRRDENSVEFLRKLWTIPLDEFDAKHFRARLVALNKVHPKIPTASEFRPIIVLSPIIKFMEARFSAKLMEYCVKRMRPSQIGFVEGYGCETNIKRLMQRSKEIREGSLFSYNVVFFDFKSAYNTVNRELLYKKLEEKHILELEEIEWLRSLHGRISIQSGDSTLRPLNGLHQCSMISPMLFDIYAEEIIEAIHTKMSIPLEDILFYADDLAVICTTNKLERLIGTVEEAAEQLSLIINRKKCGILPIHRKRRTNHIKDANIKGIPRVDYYRYLGVELNSKLEIDEYLNRIEKKVKFILARTAGFTKHAYYPENRRFIWVALVRPLFDYVLPILEDQNQATRERHRVLLKKSYKRCIGLRRTISDEILGQFIGDYDEYTRIRAQIAIMKIRDRFEGKERKIPEDIPRVFPNIHLIPDLYLRVLNLLGTGKCRECDERLGWYHLATHGLTIRNPIAVLERKISEWKALKELPLGRKRREIRRKLMSEMHKWSHHLSNLLYNLKTNLVTPWAQSR